MSASNSNFRFEIVDVIANLFLLGFSLAICLILFPFLSREFQNLLSYVVRTWNEMKTWPQKFKEAYEKERNGHQGSAAVSVATPGDDQNQPLPLLKRTLSLMSQSHSRTTSVEDSGFVSANDASSIESDEEISSTTESSAVDSDEETSPSSDEEDTEEHRLPRKADYSSYHQTTGERLDLDWNDGEHAQHGKTSQATQCTEVDFDVYELRDQLPFRNGLALAYQSAPGAYYSWRFRAGRGHDPIYAHTLHRPQGSQWADSYANPPTAPSTSTIPRPLSGSLARWTESVFPPSYSPSIQPSRPDAPTIDLTGLTADGEGDKRLKSLATPFTPDHHPLEGEQSDASKENELASTNSSTGSSPRIADTAPGTAESEAQEKKKPSAPMQQIGVLKDASRKSTVSEESDEEEDEQEQEPITPSNSNISPSSTTSGSARAAQEHQLQADIPIEVHSCTVESTLVEQIATIPLIVSRYFEVSARQRGYSPPHNSLTERERLQLLNVKEGQLYRLVYRFLPRIPYTFMEAQNITWLNLSHNMLSSLPSWFFETFRTSLTTLNLSFNLFFDVPERISDFKKLKDLNLSHNRIEYLSAPLFSLYYLQTLNVSHNSLVIVPNDIAKLVNLVDFNFSHNFVVQLPFDVRSLKRLKHLVFVGNPLFYLTIQNIIGKMTQLDELQPSVTTAASSSAPARAASVLGIRRRKLSTGANSNSMSQLPIPGSQQAQSSQDPTTPRSAQTGLFSDDALLNNGPDMDIFIDKESDEGINPVIRSEYKTFTKQMFASRPLLLLELLESERRYVQHLNVLYELYFSPLRIQSKHTKVEYELSTVDDQDLRQIMPEDLEMLIMFHRSFFVNLQTRLLSNDYNPQILEDAVIGDAFLDRARVLEQLYPGYIMTSERSLNILRDVRRNFSEFERFLQARRRLPLTDGMELDSFLVLPIHRLRKYVYYLQNILLVTPMDHPDHKPLSDALQAVTRVFLIQKEKIFFLDNTHKMIQVQAKLNIKGLAKGNRFLVREGKVTLAPSRSVMQIKKDLNKSNKSIFEAMKNLNVADISKASANLKEFSIGNLMTGEVRMMEMPVTLYLFSDCIIIKSENLLQKIVNKSQFYTLRGAEIETSEDNDKEFIVKVLESSAQNVAAAAAEKSNTASSSSTDSQRQYRYLSFICGSVLEKNAWYEDMVKQVCELQESTEETTEIDDLKELAELEKNADNPYYSDESLSDEEDDDMDMDDDDTEGITPASAATASAASAAASDQASNQELPPSVEPSSPNSGSTAKQKLRFDDFPRDETMIQVPKEQPRARSAPKQSPAPAPQSLPVPTITSPRSATSISQLSSNAASQHAAAIHKSQSVGAALSSSVAKPGHVADESKMQKSPSHSRSAK